MPSEIQPTYRRNQMAFNSSEQLNYRSNSKYASRPDVKSTSQPYIVTKLSNLKLDENESLFREIRNLLNKLTPQNMESITNQLISLQFNTEDQMTGAIEIIFKNAIDEQSYSQIYAQLCKSLSNSIKVETNADPSKKLNFRTILLTRCQKEFNTDYYQQINYDQLIKEAEQCKNETKQRELKELAEEKLMKAKRRSLGNIRFIGELFKLNMLTEVIMNDCIERLLKQDTDEENLECLCRLLTTIGSEVDKPYNAIKIKTYFEQLERIVKKKDSVTARIRFMILDVIDLRKNQWIPRRKVNNPRLLEQIRKEAAEEAEVAKDQLDEDKRSGFSSKGKNVSFDLASYAQRVQKSTQFNMINKIKDVKQITATNDNDLLLGPSSGFKWAVSSVKPTLIQPEIAIPAVEDIKPKVTISNNTLNMIENKFNYNESSFTDRQSDLGIENNFNKNNQRPSIYIKNDLNRQSDYRNNQNKNRMPQNSLNNNKKYPKPTYFKRNQYTLEEIEDKVNLFLDEYTQNKNIVEALKDFEEFKPKDENQYIDFIELIFNKVLEKSDQVRTSVGFFFYAAINEKLISLKLFTKALKNIIETIEDISIDVPKITVYLSQIVSPLIQPNFQVDFLNESCKSIQDKPICTVFIIEILNNCLNRLDPNDIIDIFRETNFKIDELLQLIDKQKNIKKLLNCGDNYLFETNVRKLLNIIENVSSELIAKRIEVEFSKNDLQTKQFIRALVTSVCLSCLDPMCRLDTVLFKKRAFILSKYINCNRDYELECLNAFQQIDYRLQHQCFIRCLFDICYDEKIISESSFWTWKKDSCEEGHEVSVLKLASFYVWLTESM